jgi:hypothetical protein
VRLSLCPARSAAELTHAPLPVQATTNRGTRAFLRVRFAAFPSSPVIMPPSASPRKKRIAPPKSPAKATPAKPAPPKAKPKDEDTMQVDGSPPPKKSANGALKRKKAVLVSDSDEEEEEREVPRKKVATSAPAAGAKGKGKEEEKEKPRTNGKARVA